MESAILAYSDTASQKGIYIFLKIKALIIMVNKLLLVLKILKSK